jgi:uncharacterized membrane protein YphA (DoxX/SURF4 family)
LASILDLIFSHRAGARVYGLAAIALGLVGLVWGDFAAVWQPVPQSVPGRTALAYIVAVALLLAGSAIQWRRTVALGALMLTALYGLGIALLHVPQVIAHPSVFVVWSGVAEQLALVAGGLVTYALSAQIDAALAKRISRIAHLVFGVCLIMFGLAHIVYIRETAEMVPAWLPPGQVFWADATAAGHIAAGVAILSGIAARTAAMLVTAMFVVFGIFVHAPAVFLDPHNHLHWAANAVNLALIGSAWVVAASLPAAQAQAELFAVNHTTGYRPNKS